MKEISCRRSRHMNELEEENSMIVLNYIAIINNKNNSNAKSLDALIFDEPQHATSPTKRPP